jgi:hypothetical protein
VLVHHADSGIDRLTSRPAGHVASIQFHRAGVWVVEAGEDAHQRRLAGAVFADEGVDLTPRHFQVRVPVRLYGAEALPDPARGKKR